MLKKINRANDEKQINKSDDEDDDDNNEVSLTLIIKTIKKMILVLVLKSNWKGRNISHYIITQVILAF